MMLNSRFELSKIEKNTRVEREICLATLENREWKENLFLPLSKIESRKRIVSCHSRKSRVEREMGTIKFSRSREKFLFLLSIFLSRARLLSMPDNNALHIRVYNSVVLYYNTAWMQVAENSKDDKVCTTRLWRQVSQLSALSARSIFVVNIISSYHLD